MTLRVQGTISINGAQAKAEAKAVAGELRKVGADATGMGQGAREAGSGVRVLGTGSKAAAADLRALAAAEKQAAADAANVGASHSAGAAGVASLTEQVNELGTASNMVAGSLDAASGAGAEMAAIAQMVRASIHPVVEEYHALQSALQQVVAYEQIGAISMREASLVHDRVARGLTELTARMEAAGISIDGTTVAMRRQDTTVQQLINRTTGMKSASEGAIADHLRHGQALDDLRARYNPLFAVTRQYELELRDIAEAERLGAISTAEAATARERAGRALIAMPGQLGQVGASSRTAAAYVGNLGFQLNDIGMMMSMGQSPFMLMMQQGPQVVQVFDQMRSAGMKIGPAFAQAFTTMLSPANLATLAVIGMGAAAVQWMTAGRAEAKSMADAMGDLSSQVGVYQSAAREAESSTSDLEKRFGTASKEARTLLLELKRLEGARALRASGLAFGSVKGDLGLSLGGAASGFGADLKIIAQTFGLDMKVALERDATAAVRNAMQEFNRSQFVIDPNDRLTRMSAAMTSLVEQTRQAVDLDGKRTEAEEELLAILVEQNLALLEQTALRNEDNGRFPGFRAAQEALDYRLQEEIAIRASVAAGREMIATLQAEGRARSLVAMFGRDSELAAQSRLAVERGLVAAQLQSEGIVGAVAAQVLAAWDNAKGFKVETAAFADLLARAHDSVVALAASAPGGGWLSGAIDDAAKLAITLYDAAVQVNNLRGIQQRLAAEGKVSSGRGGDPRTSNQQGYGEFKYTGPALDVNNNIIPKKDRGGAGGDAAAKEAKKERDAVLDLIKTLEREIELERELDPVKRQMIQYREQMTAATQAERDKVEELIIQREREKAATESLKWAQEQTGDALVDALMGGADAGERLIETLKRAALQALLLGNGPLAGLFGGGLFGGGLFGGGGAGGLGSLLGGGDLFANIGGLAGGGMVYGAGGPTDDKVPRWLSPGEFVVNARATRRHRTMLEGLNGAPGMAAGGYVGQGGGSAPVGGNVTFAPVIDARGSQDPAAVEQAARRGMALALDEYRRTGLPNDIQRSLDSPSVRRF
ncbi:MAG: phage tail length tape measure family protein [Pseudotabrizicola sp.]|uniref:phage tail length tape measure family protein n=1 Tax=Pseudotabrizicola sp. TaxID=2939647 RepID=UPI00271A7D4F|nr:phage tail length tape measure family protein [Pseudotabrizicola sp.]MDO9639692.1 phage tail length tape measure family protein [Pseudotabrizicola sp.]